MDKIIHKIHNIAVMKEEMNEEKTFEKYHHIYDTARKYLTSKPVLIYGGTAINDLLPSKLKIYKANTLPDIDLFATNARHFATSLVKHFHSKGYNTNTTTMSEALHPGTYKVYVDGIQVVDITNVSSIVYDRLYENSVVSKTHGFRIVNPQFIRMSMHFIMSKGDPDSIYRWERSLPRLMAFYKTFPPELSAACKSLAKVKTENHADTFPDNLIHDVYAVLRNSDFILFGTHELEILLGNVEHCNRVPSVIQVFSPESTNLVDVAETLCKKISKSREGGYDIKVSNLHKEDLFIPDHVFISYKGIQFATIYHSKECTTYNEYNGLKIAGIHTIIRMYLSMLLSSRPYFEEYADSIECMVNAITLKYLKERNRNKKLFKDVVSTCNGYYDGLITLRRDRIERIHRKK